MRIYPVSADKLEKLRQTLRGYGSCLLAYSGGVDSVFLARVAHETLGKKFLAVIADSPSLPRRELADALAIAEKFSFPVRVIRTREFENADYTANPANRCYFCKHELFEELAPIARAERFAVIAYGENASDVGDFRPGAAAAAEFQVRAPLKEAGLTKAEIREWSAQFGLPTADKPQMACLSSRVPHGEAVTPEKLRMIEQAENVLRDLGFHDVRVRHHEMRSAERGVGSGNASRIEPSIPSGPASVGAAQRDVPATTKVHGMGHDEVREHSAHGTPHSTLALARIELGASEIPRFLSDGLTARVSAALKQIGYTHVTLDLEGYRRGSLNETSKSRSPFQTSRAKRE